MRHRASSCAIGFPSPSPGPVWTRHEPARARTSGSPAQAVGHPWLRERWLALRHAFGPDGADGVEPRCLVDSDRATKHPAPTQAAYCPESPKSIVQSGLRPGAGFSSATIMDSLQLGSSFAPGPQSGPRGPTRPKRQLPVPSPGPITPLT